MIATPVAVNRPQEGNVRAAPPACILKPVLTIRVLTRCLRQDVPVPNRPSRRETLFLGRNRSMPLDLYPAMPAVGAPKRKDGSGIETFLLASAALLAVVCFSLATVLFALV
jgi:hypothetical protein